MLSRSANDDTSLIAAILRPNGYQFALPFYVAQVPVPELPCQGKHVEIMHYGVARQPVKLEFDSPETRH